VGENRNKIGDYIVFVDDDGISHNALVIHAWENSLNIAYVDEIESDSYGNLIVKKTSVPYKQPEMSGFYVK